MIAPNEYGRPTEAGTPVVVSARASALATTSPEDNPLDRLREVDGNATRGDHECADFGHRPYWALAKEDVPSYYAGGEPGWTVLWRCPYCAAALERDGWLMQTMARVNDPYVVAEIIGDVGGGR